MSRATNHALRDDVARWQAGHLTAEELQQRHPGTEVGAALEAHAHLLAAAQVSVPSAELAWSRLAATLPAHPALRRPRRLRRPVVAAILAAVLAAPAVSYAAAPDAVRSGLRQVTDLFTDGDDDPRPVEPAPRESPDGTAEEPDAEVEATDADEHPTVAPPPRPR